MLTTLLIASPASAVVLRDGDRITVIDEVAGAVYEASAGDASLTPIGAAAFDGRYLSAVDVGEGGQGYALLVAGNPEDESLGASQVVPFDASTGSIGSAVDVTIPSVGPGRGCSALELRDGILYTACLSGAGRTYFGILDPATGALDVLHTFDEEVLFSAFASDPLTGQFWAFEHRAVDGFSGIWIVDPDDWSFTTYLELEHPVWGADYDRAGRLFVSATVDDLPGASAALLMLNPAEGEFEPIGSFAGTDASHRFGLTIWGSAPPLAETGRADSLPIALGAVLLILAGIALVRTGRLEEA